MLKQDLQNLIQAIEHAVTLSGESLLALSAASPVLLVFLRHAGCTFCREAIGDIGRFRSQIEGSGIRIVLVHMGDRAAIEKLLDKYGLRELDRICDPQRKLYREFGLARGRFRQLFGPKILWRGFLASVVAGHGIGRVSADRRQMPGLFLIDGSCIVRRFRHRTAADRPDYAAICTAPFKPAGAR